MRTRRPTGLVRLWPALFLLLTAATPDSAVYLPTDSDLHWFLVISDVHVESAPESGKTDTVNLNWATSELVDTVQPSFLAVTGDLVDATGGGLIPVAQFEKEWESYRAIVDSNGMTADFCYDIPGNHDQYFDKGLTHYLDYSVRGRATAATNHAWTVDAGDSRYLYVALASCGSDGAPFPTDNVGLDSDDLAFLESALADHDDADIVTVFSHHPAAYYTQNKAALYDALSASGAGLFVHGHTHKHSRSWQSGTLHLELASLGKSDDNNVALAAFDGRGLALTTFAAHAWPQVLVTAPLDGLLAGNHHYDYMVPASWDQAPIRALAFHPDGVTKVTAVLDETHTIPLDPYAGPIWQATFDAGALADKPHTLAVTATGPDGLSDTHTVTFYVFDDLPDPTDIVEEPAVIEPDEVDAGPTGTDVAGAGDWETWSEETRAPDGQNPPTPDDTAADAGADAPDGAAPATPGVTGHLPAKSSGCTVGAGHSTAAGLWLLVLLALGVAALSTRRAW